MSSEAISMTRLSLLKGAVRQKMMSPPVSESLGEVFRMQCHSRFGPQCLAASVLREPRELVGGQL